MDEFDNQKLLTKINSWTEPTEGKDPDEWPADPEYDEYRVEGQMRLDVLRVMGRESDDPVDVRMVVGLIEGGWSEFTVEHDYEIEVWLHEGRQKRRVFERETYSSESALAAFLGWLTTPQPARTPRPAAQTAEKER